MGGKMSRKLLGISFLICSVVSFGEDLDRVIKLN